MKIGIFLTLSAMAAVSLPSPAWAEPPVTGAEPTTASTYSERQVDGSQVVTFTGDPLAGDANSAFGFTVRSAPMVLRQGLLRPRANFVPELLKSVENL